MTTATKAVTLPLEKRIALRNILFATDFSPVAENAMRWAARLARTFGARLYALHVEEPANYAVPPEMWRGTEELIEKQLTEVRETLAQEFRDIKVQTLTADGGVWPALALAIEKYDIDLVVVGTHGRTGMAKLLLGSEAEEILRRASVPVLTVGPKVEREGAEKLRSILYATDFGPGSQQAARYAVSFAEEYQARLTMLHVVNYGRPGDLVNPDVVRQGLERQLRNLVPREAEAWCAPEFLLEEGEAAVRILDVAEKNRADLIVLGVRKPEGLPGAATHLPIATVHHVAAHATCPVLTLRG